MTKHVRAGLGVLVVGVVLAVSSTALAATSKPAITRFTPTTAKVGTMVTITGKNLTGAKTVEFDGLKAVTFKVVSATKITAKVPTKAKSGKISVVTKNGTAMSSASLKI